ncbi:MAG: amidophosphoribosyltransferase [Candidatus Bipolaricaulia bacterium]
MCGIVGMLAQSNNHVSPEIYESAIALQHRGQDSAGMATYNGQFHIKKGMGLVRDVFGQQDMMQLKGNMGIGFNRYTTTGSHSHFEEIQPFIVNAPYGLVFAFNGNIYNAYQLKMELQERDLRHINSDSDAEVLLNVFAYELSCTKRRHFFDAICQAVKGVHERVKGGYSVVMMIAGMGLVAFRDPHGIRPLVWGKRGGFKAHGRKEQSDHIFASENTMFEVLGFEFYRDVAHGEVVFVDLQSNVHTRIVLQKEFRPCIFEYVYFARPDAFLNGVSVHRARLRMGQNLARKIKREYPDLPIDIVIPAPETADSAALACAHELGVRFSKAIVQNKFIGRTFIMAGDKARMQANRYKLSVIDFEVNGKNVLVVDDSIVRGNVSRHIVQLMKKHGAKKVYFASASPPLRWPDLYGIDLPTRDEYIAYNRTVKEIRENIGADMLIYQDLEDLVEAVTRRGDLKFSRPHTAYFDGDYPTKDVGGKVLAKVEAYRKKQRSLSI